MEKPTGGEASDKDNVKYVLSGQPTGWAAMDEVIQKYDEEKIEETKVDIDTLLVIVCFLHPFESACAWTAHRCSLLPGWLGLCSARCIPGLDVLYSAA